MRTLVEIRRSRSETLFIINALRHERDTPANVFYFNNILINIGDFCPKFIIVTIFFFHVDK